MQSIHSIIFSCLMLHNRQKKIFTKFLNFLYKTPLEQYWTNITAYHPRRKILKNLKKKIEKKFEKNSEKKFWGKFRQKFSFI